MRRMAETLRIPSITGIDVELKIAGPGARSFAFVVDWHIRALVALTWFLASIAALVGLSRLVSALGEANAAIVFFAVIPTAAIYFLYHPVLEVLMHGRTPGKRFAKVRIVSLADGATPSIGALLIRNVFRLVDSLPSLYAFGLMMTMFTKNAVRLGDIAAGTVLVFEEVERADTLDTLTSGATTRLGLAEAQLVRDLLDRWRELDPTVREGLGRKLLAKHGIDAAWDSDVECEAKLRALLT
jgi:uncharacterized RDD family membrane protein YckC